MNTLFACLPCYNEEENIIPLTLGWLEQDEVLKKEGFSLQVVAIDDKSTDSTKEKISQLEREHPQVHLVAHEKNMNLGGGVNTAVTYFLQHGVPGDLCVLMDGDNTHDPKYVHSMIQAVRRGADVVIASRYQGGAEVHGVPRHRLLLSDGAKLYYSLMLRVPKVKDYTCGYRAYTYQSLQRARKKYGDQLITQRSFACMMELLYKLYRSGCRFDEVPFSLRYDNKGGESKMRVLRTMKDSLKTAWQLRRGKI